MTEGWGKGWMILAVVSIGGAVPARASLLPYAPGGTTYGEIVSFSWTPPPAQPTAYEVRIEPTGRALSDGTAPPELAAPLSVMHVCPSEECTCQLGRCGMQVEGALTGAPDRTDLFTLDGDEYCWKVREIGPDGLPEPFSPEMCFRSENESPPFAPAALAPLDPEGGVARVSKHGPVFFDWEKSTGAFAYHVRVATALSVEGELAGELVCPGLDAVTPPTPCDESTLEPDRTYYWEVRGFKDAGSCPDTTPPGRCYGPPHSQSPSSFRLVSCAGDCDDDGEILVSELVAGVRVALGEADVAVCSNADSGDDGAVSVAELVQAVNAALNGCTG